ncbi:hypothetical protein [Microbacterium rhizophilus]|uniref:hypothetical protein n=1 Tax=Microbacterium rhizophilus TaxID=3138934 RepID=UPI0031E9FDC6
MTKGIDCMSKNTSPMTTSTTASRRGARTLRGAAAVGAAGAVIAGAAFGATAANASTGDEGHHRPAPPAVGAPTATQLEDGIVQLTGPAVAQASAHLEHKLAQAIAALDERGEKALKAAIADGSVDLGPFAGLVGGGENVDIPELPVDAGTLVADVGSEPLTSSDGAVTLDLASGDVTVDLQRLADAHGLPADATLADQAVVDAVKADVDEILASVSDRIDEQLLAEVQGAADSLPAGLTSQFEGVVDQAKGEVSRTVDGAVGEGVAPASDEIGTAADELGSLIDITVEDGGQATIDVDLPQGEAVPLAG